MSNPAPRSGVWSAAPQKLRWTFRSLPSWWWVFGPYQLWVWAVALFNLPNPDWPFAVFVLLSALWFLVWTARVVRDLTAQGKTVRDRAFSDRPEGLEEHAVEIVFAADGRYLGIDRGVVWFEEGLMGFHGAATSFVLAATDFVPRSRPQAYDDIPKHALRLDTYARPAFILLRPLFGRGTFAFRRRLRRFLRDAEPVRAARQWPPMAAYDEPEPTTPVLLDSPEAVGAEAARTGAARGVVSLKPD